uniref:Uncharacterized protein n=1 Tax=Tetranychus urticae TaxID=32264 RepID=T1K0K9_TETUR
MDKILTASSLDQSKYLSSSEKGMSLTASEDDLSGLKRASSRGVIPKAKIKSVQMTLVIVLGKLSILNTKMIKD